MSKNRRHTDIPELGWADFLAVCAHEPILRVQGRVRPGPYGKLVRFNRSVLVDVNSATRTNQGPCVHAERVRWRQSLGIWRPFDIQMCLEWRCLDWVTWKAIGDPNGTWLKVTIEGQSSFGRYEVHGSAVVDRETRERYNYNSYGEALAAAVKIASAA